MKIMLVDDSRTMRATQKKALAQLGHKDINGYPISIPRLTTVCSRSGEVRCVDARPFLP